MLNVARFIVPSMTQGAFSLSWRRAATKVCVRHEGLAMGDPAETLARDIRTLLFKRLKIFKPLKQAPGR